jgi:hypothetical protein
MEIIDNIDQSIDEIVDTIVSEYKDCTKCGISKLKNCFGKRKSSKDGLKYNCKDCVKANNAKRYQENRDEILEHQAGYYQENKVAIAEHQAGYYQENKVAIAEKQAGYYQENKVAIAEKQAGYYQENKVAIAEKQAEPEIKSKRNARRRARSKTDEGYRIENNLRKRLWEAMKGREKSASTKELVGLQSGTAIHDTLNLKSPWFKEQGIPSNKLDTDHIIPCAEYDLTDPDHQRACFHYINLQFLTKTDNMKKSDKVPEGFNFKSTLKNKLDLIARIEKDKLTYQQVLEMQKAGQLYEVKGYEV